MLSVNAQTAVRTELQQAKYAGMTSQQKADVLNSYPTTNVDRTVPDPPQSLKVILDTFAVAERKSLLRHPLVMLFAQTYTSGAFVQAARYIDALVQAGEALDGTAAKALILKTKTITTQRIGLPRFVELIRGIADCPNVITAGDIDVL